MTNEKLIQQIRINKLALHELRWQMTKTQVMTGAARELDIAIVKLTDALTALGSKFPKAE